MSAMLTARCPASGAAAGARNTIGSSSSGRTCSGPVWYGPMSMKVTSMSPVSTAWIELAAVPGLTQHDLGAGPLGTEGPQQAGEDRGMTAARTSGTLITPLG